MIHNFKRANKTLQREIADLVNKLIEFPGGLLSITYTSLNADCLEMKVGVSVLPINLRGTALRKLRKKSAEIAKFLAKKYQLPRIPRIIWLIDDSAEEADHLNYLINKLSS
ncbi:ribosome-binding factor A [Patescibacteria group bacterium]|jgi:ribosome-binding factor A|nr:ribosome-binding factor A [Patescibacteria group bacterium]HPD07861.1 ribosome-binding factor A [bacterium]HRT11131.1 ribosome-binding factor A [Patescibacteria group bacterium]HRU89970.1 ribosome-binding factor A [Patescibacteria group bacterium]